MSLITKWMIPLIKIANRAFDLVFGFLQLFGIAPIPQDRYWYYQGVCFSEMIHKGKVEQIPDFEVHNGDIFLATYSRSGTHFTAELIDCILDGGDTTRLLEVHQESRSPLFEIGHSYNVVMVLKMLLSPFGIIERAARDISGYHKSRKPPRVFKTHLPVHLMPKQLLAGKGKLIYVARNPLDTLISNWKLISSFSAGSPFSRNFKVFNDYYEAFFSGDCIYGSWFDHVVGYWKRKEKKNVLFLKFEDMKADIRGTIRRLAEFLERGPLSDETVEKIVNHCSLKSMKGNEMTAPDVFFPSSLKLKRKEGGFIRKGVVGDWKNQMSEEQAEKIKQKYQEKVASQGLILDFK